MGKIEAGNDAIIAAVERLLEQGDRELTIAAICRESKYSRSGFYHHFSSLDECLTLAFTKAVEETLIAAAPWLTSTDPELPKLWPSLRYVQDVFLKHGNLMVLVHHRLPFVFYPALQQFNDAVSSRIQIVAPWVSVGEADLLAVFLNAGDVALWEEYIVTNFSNRNIDQLFDIVYHSWTLILQLSVWTERHIDPFSRESAYIAQI